MGGESRLCPAMSRALPRALHGAMTHQREILADPESPLAPEALRDLELYFAGRPENDSTR